MKICVKGHSIEMKVNEVWYQKLFDSDIIILKTRWYQKAYEISRKQLNFEKV